MVILGLVGMPKSGKGEAAGSLYPKGWTPISMSNVLRETLFRDPTKHFKHRDSITRNDLFEGAIKYREQFGPGYIATQCLKMIEDLPEEQRQRVVIDGIRHPGEIETILQTHPDSHFLGIIADEDRDTDFEIRWKRFHSNMRQRGEHFEPHRKNKFKEQDVLEWDNPTSEFGSKIGKCLDMVAAMKESGHGTIMINGESENREQWGERVKEFAQQLEGTSGSPEKKH